MNLFREDEDIPVIKPRTLANSKSEFNVVLNKPIEVVVDMSLFPKTVKQQAEKEGNNPLC
jgi:hypothetical protein